MDSSIRAAIASHTSWSKTTDRAARTAPARRALEQKFYDSVPAEITDPVARAKAAENAKRAYYLRLAAKSADSRARRFRERADKLAESPGDAA